MAYLEKNVFLWQEISDAIMCLLIASPDQNVEDICISLPYNSKAFGITLHLSCHYDLLNVPISLVVQKFTNLKSIILHTDDMDDIGQFFYGIKDKFYALQCIHVNKASSLTDEGAFNISQNHPKILFLDLYECISLYDQGMNFLSQNCTELEELRISWCDNLTDNAIVNLTKLCPKISVLHIGASNNIMENSIIQVL